jgi:hypothetical protein
MFHSIQWNVNKEWLSHVGVRSPCLHRLDYIEYIGIVSDSLVFWALKKLANDAMVDWCENDCLKDKLPTYIYIPKDNWNLWLYLLHSRFNLKFSLKFNFKGVYFIPFCCNFPGTLVISLGFTKSALIVALIKGN